MSEYTKWLRYYFDYCHKYHVTDSISESTRLFIEKLREKRQTEVQRQQAVHALSLYHEMQKLELPSAEPAELDKTHNPTVTPPNIPQNAASQRISQYSVAGYEEKSDSPEWDEVLAKLAAEIKVRHYSRKTLKTYAILVTKISAISEK